MATYFKFPLLLGDKLLVTEDWVVTVPLALRPLIKGKRYTAYKTITILAQTILRVTYFESVNGGELSVTTGAGACITIPFEAVNQGKLMLQEPSGEETAHRIKCAKQRAATAARNMEIIKQHQCSS